MNQFFFLLYINDINNNTQSPIGLFADDSIIYRKITSETNSYIVQSDLVKLQTPLQKRANGIPLITIEYHSASFSTIGPFNDISVAFGGTLNGNLKYHSIPLNGTKNPKYHSKNHSDTIQISLAIIPPGPFKYHSMVFEWFE